MALRRDWVTYTGALNVLASRSRAAWEGRLGKGGGARRGVEGARRKHSHLPRSHAGGGKCNQYAGDG